MEMEIALDIWWNLQKKLKKKPSARTAFLNYATCGVPRWTPTPGVFGVRHWCATLNAYIKKLLQT
jgi:hypothetical protein